MCPLAILLQSVCALASGCNVPRVALTHAFVPRSYARRAQCGMLATRRGTSRAAPAAPPY
ncbi:hypothetical protein BN2475_400084 [Paraburkholderia ribeironis]|uniref:Lipoprotein n=1 Tax=Paraburkholderia ribeironis TaxID=1247936 RepID=A0A1N7S6Y6_9BURK|nr:hypothetical protein BN2475_400084 [Paraburkholderia ribeironis]